MSSTTATVPTVEPARQTPDITYYLTSPEREALATFKKNLIAAGLYSPADSKGEEHRPSHDDTVLVRFLRARSWDPSAAQVQFSDCEKWRKERKVDHLYETASVEHMELCRRFYPRWTGRRDKSGRPLYVYRLASLDPYIPQLNKITDQERFQGVVSLSEYMQRFTIPFCNYLPHPSPEPPASSLSTPSSSGSSTPSASSTSTLIPPIPIHTNTNIIDLSHVSFTSMWKLRNVLSEASRMVSANYPESLHTLIIINAPSFFPTIWSWIKTWFDKGTQDKIRILSGDPAANGAVLAELVELEHLPKVYGGNLEWVYENEPDLDEEGTELGKTLGLGEGGRLLPKGPAVFDNATVKLFGPGS